MALTAAGAQNVKGANERVNLAMIGCGGRGRYVTRGLIEKGANLTWLCDLHQGRLDQTWKFLSQVQKTKPKLVKDMSQVLDAKNVDAVVVSTPDHWHAPATILACQAGKDVYVEKPHAHNIWESTKMVEAAAKYKRIVQVGTQNRSGPYNLAALEYVKSGKLGKICLVKVYNMKSGGPFRLGNAGGITVGYGKGEMFLASDLPAILPYTDQVAFLAPGEMVSVSTDGAHYQSQVVGVVEGPGPGSHLQIERVIVAVALEILCARVGSEAQYEGTPGRIGEERFQGVLPHVGIYRGSVQVQMLKDAPGVIPGRVADIPPLGVTDDHRPLPDSRRQLLKPGIPGCAEALKKSEIELVAPHPVPGFLHDSKGGFPERIQGGVVEPAGSGRVQVQAQTQAGLLALRLGAQTGVEGNQHGGQSYRRE